MSKKAPPGWEPQEIVHRLDGWIDDPANKGRAPRAVAEMIFDAMPPLGSRSAIDRIRARMQARQHEYDRKKKVRIAHQRMLKRVKLTMNNLADGPEPEATPRLAYGSSVERGHVIPSGDVAAGVSR
jgi:hypothetical protein